MQGGVHGFESEEGKDRGGRGRLERIERWKRLSFAVYCLLLWKRQKKSTRVTHVHAFPDGFWWSFVGKTLQKPRNITVAEQAKWALFLKSFFEISEAIPWPRDHILFTFPLPTTQATLAKFTKEDPHWKIRLIPDWKFMCWLRWISSGRFSQERGVKKEGKKKEGREKKGQNWDRLWLKSGVGVTFEAGVDSLFRCGQAWQEGVMMPQ